MDLAKDILNVAEKVGQAPGLTIASSIVTSILKTVEVRAVHDPSALITCRAQTSKNNTVQLRILAHSLATQLIDISENMKDKWDDAPLTLKRAVDEYDAYVEAFIFTPDSSTYGVSAFCLRVSRASHESHSIRGCALFFSLESASEK